MHPNAALITRFYEAFQKRDAATMAACYHEDVVFSDPAFPDLRGKRAGAMWTMLCGRAKDLSIEFSEVSADDKTGKAHWDARYTFSTGNRVLNRIDATFEFRDGLIVKHTDHFDFKVWSGQALGLFGKLFGWTTFLQKKVQSEAEKGLVAFEAKSRA